MTADISAPCSEAADRLGCTCIRFAHRPYTLVIDGLCPLHGDDAGVVLLQLVERREEET